MAARESLGALIPVLTPAMLVPLLLLGARDARDRWRSGDVAAIGARLRAHRTASLMVAALGMLAAAMLRHRPSP